MKRTFASIIVLLLLLDVFVLASQAEMQSTSFRVSASVFPGGGNTMTGASYKLHTTTGLPTPLGYATSSSFIVLNGFLPVLQNTFIDSDSDGVDDTWEIYYFNNLTTADQTSDFDKDGYTDLQEYLNNLVAEPDPQGNYYDPMVKNAAGGTGYSRVSIAPILLLLLLEENE